MNFNWLKNYMPRSLFWRAVLILIVPIVGLQLIVATVFIQRHFDGVTRQLARGVALEIAVLVNSVESKGMLSNADRETAKTLGLSIQLLPAALHSREFKRHWYDISGRVIQNVLEVSLGRPVGVNLIDNFRVATFNVETTSGTLLVSSSRVRISASNPHQLIVLMVIASFFLTVISLIFLRNQVRPIRHLAFAAEEFGKGRLQPFRPSGAEEVRRAGGAFLSMRSRIERQIEQRTRMLSGVSHDLRTPLTRMKLALATADGLDDLKDIEHDVNEMEKMLEEFLSFASGDQSENTQMVDPFKLGEEICSEAKRNNTIVQQFEERDELSNNLVFLREMAIKRALQNLVGNAGKYGSTVWLTISLRAKSLVFTVEDNGPGIPTESQEEALKAFSRLDVSRSQNKGVGGVGLGLAIAKDIARNHGGSLVLSESETLGGLKAIFTLPR